VILPNPSAERRGGTAPGSREHRRPGELEAELRAAITDDPWRIAALGALAVERPEAWIAAGFVRNAVWDRLHGYAEPTPLADVDVVLFDPAAPDEADEKRLEARLGARLPGVPWSVKNQTRMHLRNGDPPYVSLADALAHWLETPTPIAIRQGATGRIEVLAPLGLDDLFALIVRPTAVTRARPDKLAQFRARMASKAWPERWPRLRVLDAI
jgi:hypothetical protein